MTDRYREQTADLAEGAELGARCPLAVFGRVLDEAKESVDRRSIRVYLVATAPRLKVYAKGTEATSELRTDAGPERG